MQRVIMKKIEITEHARQRLIERMPEVKEEQHAKLVKNARYYGKTACIIAKESPEFAKALFKLFGDSFVPSLELFPSTLT